MDNLRINRTGQTLVDQVEEKLIEYFKEQGFRPGSSIPNESDLAASLGIGRTVLREALSRFKMTGMIESRTKRGMMLAEPSLLSSLRRCMNPLLMNESTIRDIFEFRLVLEIGCTAALFARITPNDIDTLAEIVEVEKLTDGIDSLYNRCAFHDKIHEIVGNHMISEFQESIMPVMHHIMKQRESEFISKEKELRAKGEQVTHADLLSLIRRGDEDGYRSAIVKHFSMYENYLMSM